MLFAGQRDAVCDSIGEVRDGSDTVTELLSEDAHLTTHARLQRYCKPCKEDNIKIRRKYALQ